MAHLARVVVPGRHPHHVTQCGRVEVWALAPDAEPRAQGGYQISLLPFKAGDTNAAIII